MPASPRQSSLVGLQVPSARPQVNYSCCTTQPCAAESGCTRCHGGNNRLKVPGTCQTHPLAAHTTLSTRAPPCHSSFLGRDKKHASDPKAAFRGPHLQEEGLVSLAPPPLWWLRSQWVELGLERQQQGVLEGAGTCQSTLAVMSERCYHRELGAWIWGKDFVQAARPGVIKPAWTEDAASASCSTDVQL